MPFLELRPLTRCRKRGREIADLLACLAGNDRPIAEGSPIKSSAYFEFDGRALIARTQEVGVHGVNVAVVANRRIGRHQHLRKQLPTEHPGKRMFAWRMANEVVVVDAIERQEIE